MRDPRFVAVHRGGPLDVAKHRLLAAWAAECAEHVLLLFEECSSDDRPQRAVEMAKAWARGEVSVGDATEGCSRSTCSSARGYEQISNSGGTCCRPRGGDGSHGRPLPGRIDIRTESC